MSLEEILKKFQLPLQRDQHRQIRIFLDQTLDDYLNEINTCEYLSPLHDIKELGYTELSYKHRINEIVAHLKICLQLHFSGKTAMAYLVFQTLMEQTGMVNLIKTHTYPEMSSFYRIRTNEGSYALSEMDMFHIPFQSLEKISSQRFSILGYPSLYLGNSLYTCWEELNRPSESLIQSILFKNIIKIKVLDFDWTRYWHPLEQGHITQTEKLEFGILWPLFAVCNVKVPQPFINNPFKGEYVFPQLFLQYIQSNAQDLTGIRYCSSKTLYDTEYPQNKHFNIVLPVKQITSTGHCNSLKSYFVASHVEIWNVHELTNSNSQLSSIISTSYQNNELASVAMTKKFIPYRNTKFWEFEAKHNSIPNTKLKPLSQL